MSADLDQAVYALLTPARFVIDRHGNDGGHRCRTCALSWPCFELGTAIEALDLVLRVHVAARGQPKHASPEPHRRPRRPIWEPSHPTGGTDNTIEGAPASAEPA